MQWMEERALSLGSSSMRLEVGAENVAARAFYEAAGFAETGRIPDYYGPALDALVMQRPLSLHAESTSR
jgi:ribosomal protein S18 acetylase RimI-like enzyme